MGLLPDIDENGKLIPEKGAPGVFKVPRKSRAEVVNEEERMAELNNYGRAPVSQDFSDSKFADRQPVKDEEQV